MKFQNIWLGNLGELRNLRTALPKLPKLTKFPNRSPNRASLRMT